MSKTVTTIPRRIRLIAVIVLKLTLLYRPTLIILQQLTRMKEKLYPRLWQRKALLFYSQFVTDGSLCFDIGANVGNRTAIFRKLGATVIAVEPQDDCVSRLRTTFANDNRVKIVQKAVGPQEGEVNMAINTKHNDVSSCSPEWVNAVTSSGKVPDYVWDRSIKVRMTTLDNLIDEFGIPSFCKIDIEGFEYEAIKGLSHTINALSFEFHAEYLASAFGSIRRLANLGLTRFNYSFSESMQLALPKWVTAEELCSILENMPDKFACGDVYATIRELEAGSLSL